MDKIWSERGIGEAMILRHEKHKSLRFFMRQEDTLKVMANHVIDPRICLQPNSGSDESYVWSAYDFTSGELVETVFALVLENSLTATIFRNKFVESQKDMHASLKGNFGVDDTPGKSIPKNIFGNILKESPSVDGNASANDSVDKTKIYVCSRCGRDSHSIQECYAKTSVDGKSLQTSKSEGCFRCGRHSHSTWHCYARTDVYGNRLYEY